MVLWPFGKKRVSGQFDDNADTPWKNHNPWNYNIEFDIFSPILQLFPHRQRRHTHHHHSQSFLEKMQNLHLWPRHHHHHHHRSRFSINRAIESLQNVRLFGRHHHHGRNRYNRTSTLDVLSRFNPITFLAKKLFGRKRWRKIRHSNLQVDFNPFDPILKWFRRKVLRKIGINTKFNFYISWHPFAWAAKQIKHRWHQFKHSHLYHTVSPWITVARIPLILIALTAVAVGIGAGWHDQSRFMRLSCILCVLLAVFMQFAYNCLSDLWDARLGYKPRSGIGPERICAGGRIDSRSLWNGTISSALLAGITGLLLIDVADDITSAYHLHIPVRLVVVSSGIFCYLAAWLSVSVRKIPLRDLLNILMLGLLPSVLTYIMQNASFRTPIIWCYGLGMGLAAETYFLILELCDKHEDTHRGRRTIATMCSTEVTELIYLILGILATLLAVDWWHFFTLRNRLIGGLLLLYLMLHIGTFRNMIKQGNGYNLNHILFQTIRNIIVYGLVIAVTRY